MSIEKIGIHPNITVIAEDQVSFQNLSAHRFGLNVIKPPGSEELPKEEDPTVFGSADYTRFINRRPRDIHHFIQQGLEVFFVDVDTYWFKDPYPFFEGVFDVAYPKDSPALYNAGVGYYKPTNRTVAFLRCWIEILGTQRKLQQDQTVMNRLIKSKYVPHLSIRHLDGRNFPSARIFFKRKRCQTDVTKVIVFHAACLQDHGNKKDMFKQCNLWLL